MKLILFILSIAAYAQTVGTPAQLQGNGAPLDAACTSTNIGQEYFQKDATSGQESWKCKTAGQPWLRSVTVNGVTSTTTLGADLPLYGDGLKVIKPGTKSGNTNITVTTTGTQTLNDCVKIDASGNHIAAGAACGSVPFYDFQGTTSAITMTGSDVVIYTTTVPPLAAGKCYHVEYGFKNSGITSTVKFFLDSTSINQYTNGTGSPAKGSFLICNKAGVQNAQSFVFLTPFFYNNTLLIESNASGVDNYAIYESWATKDFTASGTIAMKATAASGTVTGLFWHIT